MMKFQLWKQTLWKHNKTNECCEIPMVENRLCGNTISPANTIKFLLDGTRRIFNGSEYLEDSVKFPIRGTRKL